MAGRGHANLERTKSLPSEVSLCTKYVLFIMNVMFWLLGLAMILVGVYAKTDKNLDKLGSTLPFYMDPANIIIAVGTIIFLLSFFGCLGALRENICMLRMFEYSITLLLMIEIALVVYVYLDRDRVKKGVADVLKDTIPKYRDDPDLQSIMDWTQMEVKCCGIDSFDNWERNIYFNCSTVQSPERCGVPHSCCKDYKTALNSQCGYGIRDPKFSSVQRRAVIYDLPCVDAVLNMVLEQDNMVLIVCLAGAMVLLQLISTGLAHSLVQGVRRQKERWDQNTSRMNQPNFH